TPAGIAEAHLLHAGLHPEMPGVGGVARELALDAVLVRRRPLHHVELGMGGKDLVVQAADPVASRADLAIRHGEEVRAEPRAEHLEHLLRRVEWNTAHQMKLGTHSRPPYGCAAVCTQ